MRTGEFQVRWWAIFLGLVAFGSATLWLVEPRVARLCLNSLWLCVGSCLIALPLGTLAAVAVFKTDMPGRRPVLLLFAAMLFVPLYIVTGAWDAGFGIQGWYTMSTNPHLAREPWLDGWRAAIWVHGIAAIPWVAIIVGAGLRSVEAEIEEDAATCVSPSRVLWHVTLRRAGPAVLVATLWVAIVTSAEISVTDFFQVRTFAEEVYTQSALGTIGLVTAPTPDERFELSAGGLWIGAALSVLLALVAIVAARRLFSDFADATLGRTWICRLGRSRTFWMLATLALVLIVAGVPIANLLYKAGIEVNMVGGDRVRSWSLAKVFRLIFAVAPMEYRGDLWLSAKLGVGAASAAVIAALPLAWSMRHAGRTPWVRLTLLATCLTIPGPLLGIVLIRLLSHSSNSPLAFLGALYDSNFAPWLAQTIRALPLATLILWPALASVPQAMLDMAATEGSGWWGQLFRIALPQRWTAVVAAWLVGFAIAVGELAATILVMPPAAGGVTTISVRIFQMLHYGVDDRAAAVSLLMILGVALITGAAAWMLARATKRRSKELSGMNVTS